MRHARTLKRMLQVQDICKSYGPRQVLAPIRFFLPEGQCLGVVGGNGSGKSTLLQLLAQVQRPDKGDILFDGRSVLGDRAFLRRCVGYVPQDNGLAEELTVLSQLKLWQSACGQSGGFDEEIVSMLGLEELFPRRIATLSGGMQRRVSISMALLTHPKLLLMDEATTGLDQAYCSQLLDWLEKFLSRGGSLVWCSHHPEEIRRLCGSVLTLQEGKPIE